MQLVVEHQQQRFKLGDISMVDLLDAHLKLYEANETQLQLNLDACLALIASYRSLGGGWPEHESPER